jgi:glycosyltransferase involved in cell wall biosynthesis
MRIVHVTDAYLPHLGGIETHVADLAARQRADGHQVHVVTSTSGRSDDATVHRLPGGWWREALVGSAVSARAVRGLDPDVVHCHNSVLSPLAVNVAVNASATDVPVAVTVHSVLPAVGPLLPASGVLLAVRDNPIAWSAVSEVAAAPLRRVLGPGRRVDVLPNAVDVDWWRSAPPPGTGADVVRVVSAGRLAVRKRVLPLVRMLAEVRRRIPDDVPLELVLAGDGPQARRLAAEVTARGMTGWVRLPGRLDRAGIRDLLATADLYVAPARLESFGIAALEARCAGLPVVARAAGGVTGFVEPGRGGLLVDDDRGMVEAIARLVTDHDERRRMRAHNRAVPPAATWTHALARTEQLYARARHLAGVSATTRPRVPVTAEEAER